jgi:protein involved in polysaccharide export with SLBB domain
MGLRMKVRNNPPFDKCLSSAKTPIFWNGTGWIAGTARFFCPIFLVLFVNFVTAAGQERTPQPVATPISPLQLIHFGDVIDVDVVGSLEFDWRGGLTPEGYLDGFERLERPVFAMCKTEQEVAELIRQQFSRILRSPEVVVRTIDRTGRAHAYVTGAVRTPQRFQLKRPVDLIELIVLSGGVTDASNGEITIFRPPQVNCQPLNPSDPTIKISVGRTPERRTIKISDLITGQPDANVRIVSGDIVNVTENTPVFVMGDVLSPRRLNLTPELTLTRAIAAAGGAARPYRGQKVRIHRRGSASGPIELDLRKIETAEPADYPLEPYDVIEVDQKGVEPRKLAGIPADDAGRGKAMSRLPLRIVD